VHPLRVAPEPLEEWCHSFKGFLLLIVLREYLGDRVHVFTCNAYFPDAGEAPEPLPRDNGQSGPFLTSFYAPHSSFCSEEGWEESHYPRWASNDVPGELLAAKSKWMSESHSIGVGLWPYGHISRYPRVVMVDVGSIR
jgi:hypothetical protein